jgi:hypothetical protein
MRPARGAQPQVPAALIRSICFMLIPLAPIQVHVRGFIRRHRTKTCGENLRGTVDAICGGSNLEKNKKIHRARCGFAARSACVDGSGGGGHFCGLLAPNPMEHQLAQSIGEDRLSGAFEAGSPGHFKGRATRLACACDAAIDELRHNRDPVILKSPARY